MNLDSYRTMQSSRLSFTREQSSQFAKQVAGDFNPLHDVVAKRFCVPGDLLFAALAEKYGLSRRTHIEFNKLVDDTASFDLPESFSESLNLISSDDADCLKLSHSGNVVDYNARIAALVTKYVKFSGLTFPNVLVPLMKANDVVIHPTRPLVIYRSMQIELNDAGMEFFQDSADTGTESLDLTLVDSHLAVNGKKAEADLQFEILNASIGLGSGSKRMLLGGLRPYDQSTVDDIVTRYNSWRESYQQH